MYEDFSLRQVLDIEVSQERVENLKKLTHLDLSEGTPEAVKDFMLRQWAQQVNITYARFMADIKFTPADVDELMQGAIDIHAHGGSDPFDRLLPEDEVCKDYTKAGMAAVVFKTWYTPSASRNMLINRMMEDWASQLLLAYGVSKAAIRKIFAINTAKHLDIEPTVSLDDLK